LLGNGVSWPNLKYRHLASAALLASWVSAASAENPYQVAWWTQFGTTAVEIGLSVDIDAVGNAYISGFTAGNLDGNNSGGNDAFLRKYSPSGDLLWARQIGTARNDRSFSVAIDAVGNAYICGDTEGSLGGPNGGDTDTFVVKYDPSGSLLWSRQISTARSEESHSIAVDAVGNAYVSGFTLNDTEGMSAGRTDAFLTKFDTFGNRLWSRLIGTSNDDGSNSVAADAAGNAYISGYLDIRDTALPSGDAFLAKYDPSGNRLWSRRLGTVEWEQSAGVAVDPAGNVYISGHTLGSLAGPNAGGADAFLAKYDTSGGFLWWRQLGTPSDDVSWSLAVDASGEAYISGQTSGSLGAHNAGDRDAFLTKFDASGTVLWSRQIGSPTFDASRAIAVDRIGNAYIGGSSRGHLAGPNAGSDDAFLIKFTAVPEPTSLALIGLGVAITRLSTCCRRGWLRVDHSVSP